MITKLQWFHLLLTSFIAIPSNCWDLRSHAIGTNYYASSLAVFRNRAFLTLPRSSCYNNLTNPTLIEVPWTGEQKNVIVRRRIEFPPNVDNQNWGKCADLQDTIAVDVENRWSRLWVLDKGTKKCAPKILTYSLIFNIETDRYDLKGVNWQSLHSLVVDSEGSRVFVAADGNGGLIVFSTDQETWTRFTIEAEEMHLPISLYFLTRSKTKNELYFSGKDGDELFSINLEALTADQRELNATFLGHKLGPSSGLMADLKDGLTYFLTRDYAIVRWNTNKPLMAEYHEVLSQSYETLPFVSHFFTGPQNGVWALVNPFKTKECESIRRGIQATTDAPLLKTRTIKMLNYVKRAKKTKMLL